MKEFNSVYSLMYEHKAKHPYSHFFDHDTLKFFGEIISDMRLLKGTAKITDWSGVEHTCYVLSTLQRNNPAGPKRHYAYFDVDTLDVIHGD